MIRCDNVKPHNKTRFVCTVTYTRRMQSSGHSVGVSTVRRVQGSLTESSECLERSILADSIQKRSWKCVFMV